MKPDLFKKKRKSNAPLIVGIIIGIGIGCMGLCLVIAIISAISMPNDLAAAKKAHAETNSKQESKEGLLESTDRDLRRLAEEGASGLDWEQIVIHKTRTKGDLADSIAIYIYGQLGSGISRQEVEKAARSVVEREWRKATQSGWKKCPKKCPECDGKGSLKCKAGCTNGLIGQGMKCSHCLGTGHVKCWRCKGEGKIR
jgi:hypothetical protein